MRRFLLGLTCRRVSERTDGPGGVCLDDAAEFCDWLLQEAAPPVQEVPERREERRRVRSHCCVFGRKDTGVVLGQVCDQSDVSDDQLVFQEKVFEEDVLLLQGDGVGAEQAPQRLWAGSLQAGGAGAAGLLLREAQRLQDAVLA